MQSKLCHLFSRGCTRRARWLAFIDKQRHTATYVNYYNVLFISSFLCSTDLNRSCRGTGGENRRENRFSEHQKVLPSPLLDEMSVSRSTAGDAARWVTEGSVVTFSRPEYGIFWCRSIASILDPSPFRPAIWPTTSQLVCILLWENDEKKDPERLPGDSVIISDSPSGGLQPSSFMSYPQIMMASKIRPAVQPAVTSELFGVIDRIWWAP